MTHLLVSLALSKIALIGLPGLVIAAAIAGRMFLGLPRQTLLWAGIVAAFLIWGGMLIRLGAADVQARWDAAIAADARRVTNANQNAAQTYIQLEETRDDADRHADDLADAFAAVTALAGLPDAPQPAACDVPRPGDAQRLLDIWRGRGS